MDNNTKDQLINYIKGQLQLGVQESVILNAIKANGWTDKDYADLSAIAKAQLSAVTNIIKPPETPINAMPTSTVQMSTAQPIRIAEIVNKKSKSSFGKIFFIIIILLVIIFGISYTYQDRANIVNIPIVKSLLEKIGLSNLLNNQLQIVPAATTTETIATTTVQESTTTSILSSTKNIASSTSIQTVSGIKDCGNDINCFITAANNCQKSIVIQSQHIDHTPIFDVGSLDIKNQMQILGKTTNNCLLQLKTLDYKLIYNSTTTASLISSGKTQADILKMEQDVDNQAIGIIQNCTLSLNKNMGNAINETFVNPNGNLNVDTQASLSVNGSISTSTYDSGLICTSK